MDSAMQMHLAWKMPLNLHY